MVWRQPPVPRDVDGSFKPISRHDGITLSRLIVLHCHNVMHYISTGGAGKLLLCWKVITFAGVPHMGCHEMWVCPAFWPHFTKKVKQYIEQNTTKALPSAAPQGGRRFAPAPLGVCCIFSMYCLTFSVKCGQNAGHTHISWHPLWGTPAKVMTFQQSYDFPTPPVTFTFNLKRKLTLEHKQTHTNKKTKTNFYL